MNNLRPIRLLPARERVASVLRKAILSKEITVGTSIRLEDVASQLGVSHTPVREAFQILARDGLIKLQPNKCAEVLTITPKFIRDHYETRRILECAAISIVCTNGCNTKEIENAHRQCESSLKSQDYSDYTHFNQAFHMAIWTASDNQKIKHLLSELWNGLSIAKNITETENAKASMIEHAQILEAILARDVNLAKKRMSDHLIRSMNNILTRFE